MTFDLPWQPLYPSQRSGEVSLERAMWRGEERRFAVQWYEDRAYFRLLEGEPNVWASLDACEEQDAAACFQEALESRRYGVCFSHASDVRRHAMWMNLHFIYAPDGTGLLREWSSRDWLAFAPEETRIWPLLPDTVLPEESSFRWRVPESFGCCRAAIHSVEDELFFRRVDDEEIERLSWRCQATQAEFEHVMRLLWIGGLFRPDGAQSDGGSARAGNYGNDLKGYFYVHCDWTMNRAMMDWLRAYFTPQGLEWQSNDWGKRRFRKLRAREPRLRAWFRPQSMLWNVRFSEQATFHEQLEARFELRQWLREKAPDAQIEAWLAPQT